MAIRADQRCGNPNIPAAADSSREIFPHIRTNPDTGETDYYFPLEITDPSTRALARAQGLEICRTRLGSRILEAVMVPCKETAVVHGLEVYIDTPSEVQRRRYLALMQLELDTREDAGRDGSRP